MTRPAGAVTHVADEIEPAMKLGLSIELLDSRCC
jgi:hypothetical protein